MKRLTPVEERIYNQGERLIPGVTMGVAELVRHRSSYLFFKRIIEHDRTLGVVGDGPLSIVDLGCGVGHGCCTLAEIPNVRVLGVDSSAESLEYARVYYPRENVEYTVADLSAFVPQMPEFDYAVSRGSLEHVPNGLQLARAARARLRMMFDVPYAEPPGTNPHHLVHDIREDAFRAWENAELFFQDLWGAIYDTTTKPPRPNVIVCVTAGPRLPRVSAASAFPVPAWEPPGTTAKLWMAVEKGMVLGGRAKRSLKALV